MIVVASLCVTRSRSVWVKRIGTVAWRWSGSVGSRVTWTPQWRKSRYSAVGIHEITAMMHHWIIVTCLRTHCTHVSLRTIGLVDRFRETRPASSNSDRYQSGIATEHGAWGIQMESTGAWGFIHFPASKAGSVRTMPYWRVQRAARDETLAIRNIKILARSNRFRVASYVVKRPYHITWRIVYSWFCE